MDRLVLLRVTLLVRLCVCVCVFVCVGEHKGESSQVHCYMQKKQEMLSDSGSILYMEHLKRRHTHTYTYNTILLLCVVNKWSLSLMYTNRGL